VTKDEVNEGSQRLESRKTAAQTVGDLVPPERRSPGEERQQTEEEVKLFSLAEIQIRPGREKRTDTVRVEHRKHAKLGRLEAYGTLTELHRS
jgi:hypothetical protein